VPYGPEHFALIVVEVERLPGLACSPYPLIFVIEDRLELAEAGLATSTFVMMMKITRLRAEAVLDGRRRD